MGSTWRLFLEYKTETINYNLINANYYIVSGLTAYVFVFFVVVPVKLTAVDSAAMATAAAAAAVDVAGGGTVPKNCTLLGSYGRRKQKKRRQNALCGRGGPRSRGASAHTACGHFVAHQHYFNNLTFGECTLTERRVLWFIYRQTPTIRLLRGCFPSLNGRAQLTMLTENYMRARAPAMAGHNMKRSLLSHMLITSKPYYTAMNTKLFYWLIQGSRTECKNFISELIKPVGYGNLCKVIKFTQTEREWGVKKILQNYFSTCRVETFFIRIAINYDYYAIETYGFVCVKASSAWCKMHQIVHEN